MKYSGELRSGEMFILPLFAGTLSSILGKNPPQGLAIATQLFFKI